MSTMKGLLCSELQTELLSLLAEICSEDVNMQLKATIQLRQILSIGWEPTIEEVVQSGVVQSGVVPRLVEFLTREDFPKLQYEASDVLTKITSGTAEMTKVVIDHGAVPNFVKLLVSPPSDDVREMAVMALGNIASEFPTRRDLVLSHGALAPLQAMLNQHTKLSTLRLATWTLSKLWWGNPEPWFKQTSFWKFDGADFTYLSELFLHSSSSVITPTLQNVETDDDLQTQVPHDREQNPDDGIIAIMKSLTEATKRSITLTLPDIQTLIYEQTRYAGAFLDPPSGGMVMGRLSFSINGGFPTNDKKCMRGVYIPTDINEVGDMSSDALFILLVDRDDIYVTLDHRRFWDRFPCIIVNLRGRPCVFTWLFVWKMKIELKLPVLALVDGAPYNLKKLSVYGSHNNILYDVKWLGFRPTDWDKHKIPEQFRVPMDDRDIKDCKDLLEDDFVKKNPRRVEELKLMLKLKQKVEVETLYFHRGDYLTDVFLPQKLREQDWL